MVYTRATKRIALFHRNNIQKPVDFNSLDRGRYHPQKDQLYFQDIKVALDYIFDHDKFRATEKNDKHNVKYKNKKYQQQAENRERRAKLRTVD